MDALVSIVGRERCRLGESPLWDPTLGKLFWVDAIAPAIWSFDPVTGEQKALPAPGLIANIVLGAPGSLIVTLSHDIRRLDLVSGAFTALIPAPELGPGVRLNDGKTDRAGRLITGSMRHAGSGALGKLYRFDRGAPEPEVLATGIEISNAICFSPSGDRLYFADSLRQAIWMHAYDTLTGRLGPRAVLIDTQPLGSAPDGATVDAEGRLWIALVQSGQVACVNPDGGVEQLIDTPIPFPSRPAFGCEDLDTLFVTSIADSGGRLHTDHRDGGRLMAISGLGVRGLAETRCRL
jgi:L-arabinonolactonase